LRREVKNTLTKIFPRLYKLQTKDIICILFKCVKWI
jgi:hypothetical protein